MSLAAGNVPAGGTTGQVLEKNSNTDYDTVWANPQVLIGAQSIPANPTSTTALSTTFAGTTNQVLFYSSTGTLAWGLVSSANLTGVFASSVITGIIAVPFGGTGTSALTVNGIVVGNTTSSVKIIAPDTGGKALIAQGTASIPAFQTIVGDLSLTSAGTATIANNAVTYAKFQQAVALSVIANTSSATNNVTALAGTANQVLFVNQAGTGLVFGQLNLTASVSGILPVAQGGSGTSAITANALVVGSGTNPVGIIAADTGGKALIAQGTAAIPAFQTVIGDLSLTSGGTATIANNAVTYAKFQQMPGLSVHANTSSATANSTSVVGTANQVLVINSPGTGVVFGQVNLTAGVTGILPIANGGTNASVAATAIVNLGGLSLTTTGQAFSGGVTLTTLSLGTAAGGTTTLVAGNPPTQRIVLNGTATFVAPSSDCEIDLLVTNAGSASTLTFSGYTGTSSTGDTFTTTNGSSYIFMSRTINAISTYAWKLAK